MMPLIKIAPTKNTLWFTSAILLACNALMVFVYWKVAGLKSLNLNVFIGMAIATFISLFLILKEYKTFVLTTDKLIITYSFLSWALRPMVFKLKDISEFKVIKYSYQVRAIPVLIIRFTKNQGGYGKRRILFSLQNKIKEFRELIDELRNRNLNVITEGDYFYPEL